MALKDPERVPEAMRERYAAVIALTDGFCLSRLNEEYAALCRRMAAALGRKRPSPLSSGRVGSWACGIAYAAGRINFLFDPSQNPHLRAEELCQGFGVSASTGSAKARTVMDALDCTPLDPSWTLPSRLADNPLVWMIEVNGLIVDVRYAPRDLQEEAFRRGLIPYLP